MTLNISREKKQKLGWEKSPLYEKKTRNNETKLSNKD